MCNVLTFLTNNNAKVLELISDNQIEFNNNVYCPLSQIEIAKAVGISRNTTISIVKNLVNNNLLIQHKNMKRYCLTDKGKKVIKLLKENI